MHPFMSVEPCWEGRDVTVVTVGSECLAHEHGGKSVLS